MNMDERPFRDVNSILEGITTSTTTGSFSYTPDQMRDIIKGFLDLAESYRKSLANAEVIARVEAPGLEYASESHAASTRAMGEDYRRSIEDSRQYCLAQAQKFQDTLDDYLGLEHSNVEQVNQAPRDVQPGPVDGI
jgi:hypothetical protein